MALTFPYPLEFLSDTLCARGPIRLNFRRAEDTFQNGLDRWTVQKAPPRWVASVSLMTEDRAKARAIDAKVRALGTNKTMLFADKFYRGPSEIALDDPALDGVTLAQINADRTLIRFIGLNSGRWLRAGDRFSFENNGRYHFHEVVEDIGGAGANLTGLRTIHPAIHPSVVSVGQAVEFRKPFMAMRVETHMPFEGYHGRVSRNSELSLIQKV